MSRTTANTVTPPASYADLSYLAARLYAAKGIFSKEVTSEDQAFAILIAGKELGYPPLVSARSFAFVSGRLSMSAMATVGLVVGKTDVCQYFRLVESTAERATYTTHRVGAPEPVTLTWTIEQARRAGLVKGPIWTAHPEAMLRARCGAALARDVYPDLVGGIYDADEIAEAEAHAMADPTAPGALFSALRADLAEVSTLAQARAAWQRHDAQLQASGVADEAAAIVRDHLSGCGYTMVASDHRAALAGTMPTALEAAYDALAQVFAREGDDDFALAVADVTGVLRAMPKDTPGPAKKAAFAAGIAKLVNVGMVEADARQQLASALKPKAPDSPEGAAHGGAT